MNAGNELALNDFLIKATQRVLERCDRLATFSSMEDGILRQYLTHEHATANHQVSDWMFCAGMSTHQDSVGNVWGRLGPADRPALVVGSHLDSVPDAGRYDGILGVLLGIALAEYLKHFEVQIRLPLEVVGFGDEEGTRFARTLMTSKAIAGSWDTEWFDLLDEDGVSLEEAMIGFGLDTNAVEAASRKPETIRAFLEPHIEQGPVLVNEDVPVGVVTAIAGAIRLLITVSGQAAHAGTTPMNMRSDALAGAAEMIVFIEKCASELGVVGTVGSIQSYPGGTNIVPGRVEFSLDLRASADKDRDIAMEKISVSLSEISKRRGLAIHIDTTHEAPAAKCSDSIQRCLATAIASRQLPTISMPSGAGHDTMAMSEVVPSGMLFIRCGEGISHNPLENVDRSDVQVALDVLIHAFLKMNLE